MKYIKPLAICLILMAIIGYFRRSPTDDDAWFAEESYWLLKEGKIKSEFFRGLLGWENNYFLSHKLFIALGAGLQYLLPLSPYTSKLSGLLFFMILVFLLVLYVKQQATDTYFWLLLVLIFSNTLLVKMSFENRPEMMVATLGFASFLLIYKKSELWKSALAGFIGGLAVLSHLNGIIYILAGFGMLILAKKHINALVFSILSILTCSLYFYDIWYFNGFETWLFQFRNDPATQNAFGFIDKIKVIMSYPKLFFESPEQAVLSLLLLTLIWLCRKSLKVLDKNLVIYSVSLFLSFWLLTKRASGIYQTLFIPTIFVLVIDLYLKNKQIQQNKVFYVVGFIYLCVGIIGNGQIIIKNLTHNLPHQYEELSAKITSRKSGIVPLTFFFNEYPKYNKLLCQTNFELQTRYRTTTIFYDWAKQNKADFILLDYENSFSEYYPIKDTPNISDFVLIFSSPQFSVYGYKVARPK